MREWAKAIEVNPIGSVHLARAVLPGMKERGRGKIILLSGGGAAYARPFFTSYSSSQAALVRFAESLRAFLDVLCRHSDEREPGPNVPQIWLSMFCRNWPGRMFADRVGEYLLDIGTPENYAKAQASWPGLAAADSSAKSGLSPPSFGCEQE